VASFAGFAPVSSPAISVAVVIDTPTVGASKYGGAVSAPVFATVAQQVLEYLGVPHDQPLKTKKEMLVAEKDVVDDAPADSTADLNAMFDDVNSLPADDPLRMPANSAAAVVSGSDTSAAATKPKVAVKAPGVLDLPPAKVVDAFQAPSGVGSAMIREDEAAAHLTAPKDVPPMQVKEKGAVVVNAGLQVPVPSFEGAALRSVVERADSVGLRVQAVGSGLAREQVPVAGTMVPAGTEVVVRFVR
jgi:cell division protein FtsI (penicillin-binding protein 3)